MALNGFTRRVIADSGETFANAYYKIVGLDVRNATNNKRVAFRINVYTSQSAFRSGKNPLQGPSRDASFIVTNRNLEKEFDIWFADAILKEDGKSALSQAYLYAKAKLGECTDVEE